MKTLTVAILFLIFLSGCAEKSDKDVPNIAGDLSKEEKLCFESLSLPYSIDIDHESVKCLIDKGSVIIYPEYDFKDIPESTIIKQSLIQVKATKSGPQSKEVCIKNSCLEISYRKNGDFLKTTPFEKQKPPAP